jgi:hypothetical protein
LGFPESKDVSWKLRHLADFADFVKDFAAEPGLIPHGPVLAGGELLRVC